MDILLYKQSLECAGSLCSFWLAFPSLEPLPCNPAGVRVIWSSVFRVRFIRSRAFTLWMEAGWVRGTPSCTFLECSLYDTELGGRVRSDGDLFLGRDLSPQLGAERKEDPIFLALRIPVKLVMLTWARG